MILTILEESMYLFLSVSTLFLNLVLQNLSIGTFSYLILSAIGFDVLVLIVLLTKVSDSNLN